MSIINLSNHLLTQHGHSPAARDLASILNQIMIAGKIISRDINKAGLVDIIGSTGTTNIQDEEVQKLDVHSNQTMISLLSQLPQIRAIGSEEDDKIIDIKEHAATGKYIVLMDPLDGSSNIDVNVSVGTIFVIFKKKSGGKKLLKSDYLQPGKEVVAAGYIQYGSSTMLVYSSGYGVHGFTLDPSIGEYILSHPHIKLPKHNTIYSINESYSPKWDQKITKMVESFKTKNNPSGQPLKARYIGSMVSDCHRNLLKGGIFIYPADKKNPNGKLRLMFEAIPFGYLYVQAGGSATDGENDLLKIVPKELHQRVPVFLGCK